MRRLIAILLLLLLLPACEWHRIKRADSPPIVFYSLFGRAWGWEGERQLSNDEITALQEEIKTERQLRRAERAVVRLQHTTERHARHEQRAHTRKERTAKSILRQLSPAERYKRMGSMPNRMIIKQMSSHMGGMITQTSSYEYPVSWQNDAADHPMTIINKTKQTLFIDTSTDPLSLKSPQLYGVLPDHERRVTQLPHKKLGVWKKQSHNEPIDELIRVLSLEHPLADTLPHISSEIDKVIIEEMPSGHLSVEIVPVFKK